MFLSSAKAAIGAPIAPTSVAASKRRLAFIINLPNELRKVVPVFIVTCPATLGGEIMLVPPFELRC